MNESFNFDELEIIGGNGNSKVYRPISNYEGIVIKTPNSNYAIDRICEVYGTIKSLGVPTLALMRICSVENRTALLCEDISCGTEIFVSPNSVETEKDLQLRLLTEASVFIKHKEAHIENKCEQELYRNKIDGIANLKYFLEVVKSNLIKLSENNIFVEYDSYFFGLLRNERNVALSFKIADFDNIISECDREDLYELNVNEFVASIKQFVDSFVIGTNQSSILEKINNFDWQL